MRNWHCECGRSAHITVWPVHCLCGRVHRENGRVQQPGPQPLRGLGDLVHTLLGAVGIRPKGCGGCSRRREQLNRLLPFRRSGGPRTEGGEPE